MLLPAAVGGRPEAPFAPRGFFTPLLANFWKNGEGDMGLRRFDIGGGFGEWSLLLLLLLLLSLFMLTLLTVNFCQ